MAMAMSCTFGANAATAENAPTSPPPSSHALVLQTNESLIEQAARSFDGLDIDDANAVFASVLAALPARVNIRTTENYYYFRFLHDGVWYAGNVRLDASDRDTGKLHFAYFREQTPWMPDTEAHQLVLDAAKGVLVERTGRLTYKVSAVGASVTFALNDTSGLKPQDHVLLAGEQYLGPVFDESGFRFFLIFNSRALIFHFILDERERCPDQLVATDLTARVLIGLRTGFVFYEDDRTARKLLIGVHADNLALNNYYDGPFDQLPDNSIQGDALRNAIVTAHPDIAGKIDRLGHYIGRDARYLLAPYMAYYKTADLLPIVECAKRLAPDSADYARCFAIGSVDRGN